MRLLDIHNTVKGILEVNEAARKNDYILWIEVIEQSCAACYLDEPFEWVILHAKEIGLPSLESVGRSRRKIQSEFPEYKDAATAEMRAEAEKEFAGYAKADLT